MLPILISIGPFHLYSLSVFIVLSWCVFSFMFWRAMREFATAEEKTFDLMFYGTIEALLGARAVYVAGSWTQFAASPLTIIAIWIAPGLSLYGGLISAILVMLLLGRSSKVRIGSILDALSLSLPGAMLIGKIGSLLGAAEVGRPTQLPLSIFYAGYPGGRHPVQLYEMIVLLVLVIGAGIFTGRSLKRRWPYGMVGIVFFVVFSAAFFGLEFLKEGSVHWQGLSANQWILLGLLCESLGALYIRGGGRMWTARVVEGLYARISK